MTSSNANDHVVRTLRRRLLPMAMFFGLLCALLPPLLFTLTGYQHIKTHTRLHSQHMAQRVEQDAIRNPHVWPYRLEKILPKAISPDNLPQELRVINCKGRTLLHQKHETHRSILKTTQDVRITLHQRDLATLRLTTYAPNLLQQILLLLTLSSALGALLGTLLYTIPMRTIYAQSRKLDDINDSLRQAKDTLQQNNETLQVRIDEAILSIKSLSARQIQIQDQERARIARDLHDGLGQTLSALILNIERISALDPLAKSQAQRLSTQTLSELRTIINDLRPIALQEHGLVDVLKDLSEAYELRSGIATYFKHEGETHVPESIAMSLLRIFQEALNNVSKHAQALELSIHLKVSSQTITLLVRDDGIGFDPQQVHHGHGLRNLKERVQLMDGTYQYDTQPGQGTTLRVHIPYDIG